MRHNRKDSHNPKLQVDIQPNIGLTRVARHSIVETFKPSPVHDESQKKILKDE